MLRRSIRLLLTILLCVLLAYAPEIFTAVSAPYKSELPERTLLRIALCTQNAESASSFYDALNDFRQLHPGMHLRVQRIDAAQLSALPEPLPDVLAVSSDVDPDPNSFLPFRLTDKSPSARLYPFVCKKGEALMCAVYADAHAQDAAVSLVSYLYMCAQPDGGSGD